MLGQQPSVWIVASRGLIKTVSRPLPDQAHLSGLWIEYPPHISAETLLKIEAVQPLMGELKSSNSAAMLFSIVLQREKKEVKCKEKTPTGVCLFSAHLPETERIKGELSSEREEKSGLGSPKITIKAK